MMELTLRGTFTFFSPDWDEISQTAKMFVTSLIEVDIKKRLNCKHALDHPWLKVEVVEKKPLNIAANLEKHFNAKKKLKVGMNAVKFISAITMVMSAKSPKPPTDVKDPAEPGAPGLEVNKIERANTNTN
jgi:serine/threonine protein kinase